MGVRGTQNQQNQGYYICVLTHRNGEIGDTMPVYQDTKTRKSEKICVLTHGTGKIGDTMSVYIFQDTKTRKSGLLYLCINTWKRENRGYYACISGHKIV